MKTNILEREELAIVSCAEFAQKLNLKTVFDGSGSLTLTAEEINRPGLQLAGYFDHFVPERIQVIGNAENTFMKYLPEKIKIKVLDQYFSKQFPCLIVCRDLEIDDYIIEFAKKYDIPLFLYFVILASQSFLIIGSICLFAPLDVLFKITQSYKSFCLIKLFFTENSFDSSTKSALFITYKIGFPAATVLNSGFKHEKGALASRT